MEALFEYVYRYYVSERDELISKKLSDSRLVKKHKSGERNSK